MPFIFLGIIEFLISFLDMINNFQLHNIFFYNYVFVCILFVFYQNYLDYHNNFLLDYLLLDQNYCFPKYKVISLYLQFHLK